MILTALNHSTLTSPLSQPWERGKLSPIRKIFKLGIIFIAFQITNVFTQAQTAYLIIESENEETILDLSLELSASWIMRWNHSVTGVTVSDYYHWNGQEMLLTDSHTPAFDAGLGHIPERGKLESDGFGGYFIFDIDEAVPNNRYVLRVGSKRVNHRIEHGNQVYSLSEKVENQRVFIQVVSK